MTRRFSILLLSLVAVLALAMPSFAQTTTSLVIFNSVPSYEGVYDGYYAGVYQASVNGVATNVICDDFLTDINYGQQWNAWNNNSSAVSYNGNGSGPGTGVRYAPTSLYSVSGHSDMYVMLNPDLAKSEPGPCQV